jgi:AcrR family transcriptional regulator
MAPATSPTSPRQDATRQRLIDASVRRFREDGYATTTVATIAADAGVTERTFFRYFPTKADVLAANWELHADALRATLFVERDGELEVVVRNALTVYAERVRDEIGDAIDSVLRVISDPTAFHALLIRVLEVEHDLATEIGRRSGRSPDDLHVRVLANACVGAFRAALRSAVVRGDVAALPDLLDEGLDELRSLFATVDA